MFFSSDPSQPGGVQEHVYYLSRELIRRGHLVDIYGPAGKALNYRHYHEIGKVIQVPIPNGNMANLHVAANGKTNVAALINSRGYDILHVHEPYIPFLAWELIREVKVPKVGTFHAAWNDESVLNFFNSLIPFFQKPFSESFRAAIFVSQITRKVWQAVCANSVRQEIIYNGIDLNVYKPAEQPKKGRKRMEILFVGRLVQRKGPLHFLKALEPLFVKYPNLHATILGDGYELKKVNEYIGKRRMDGNIELAGFVVGRDKVPYYQRADIFCAPYKDEAFPITILEAMAAGLPIAGFFNEAFEESLTGYPDPSLIVPRNNVARLSAALEKLINDAGLRRLIRQFNLAAVKKYDWKRVVDETERVYNEIFNE